MTFHPAQGRDAASDQRGVWRRIREQRAAASARHRSTTQYRVATWSRIEPAAAGWWLVLFACLFVPYLPSAQRRDGIADLALVAATFSTLITIVHLRFGDRLRVDDRGIYSVRGRFSRTLVFKPIWLILMTPPPKLWVPLDEISDISARRWFPRYDSEHDRGAGSSRARRVFADQTLAARYLDGTYVELLARGRGWLRPVLLYRTGSRWRSRWRPLRNDDGRILVWRSETDAIVARHVFASVSAIRLAIEQGAVDPRPQYSYPPTVGAPAGRWFWGDRHRSLPALREYLRGAYSEAVDGDDEPVVPAIPEPTLPRPVLPDDGGSVPLTDLSVPCRYWTLASARAGGVFGRRPWMVIDSTGVRFHRPWRRDVRLAIGEIDEFDIHWAGTGGPSEMTPDAPVTGNWRLWLILNDGARVPLSGLSHGYFKRNMLFWAKGRHARQPLGSMPWPNDQPLLVAARLNAHLDAARSIAAGSSQSATRPLAPRRSSR